MNDDELRAMLDGLSEDEMQAVLEALRDLRDQLADLDRRVSALEVARSDRG